MLSRDEWEAFNNKAEWEGIHYYLLDYGAPYQLLEADLELQSLVKTYVEAWENLNTRLLQYETFYDNNPYDFEFETDGIERTV